MKLKSEKKLTSRSAAEVFSFLSDMNNYKRLMPDQVTDWNSTTDHCEFNITGAGKISMDILERAPISEIRMSGRAASTVQFKMNCSIISENESSVVQWFLEAELNPFLESLASKPLQNFLDGLANRYAA